jgi:hypothetical protein
MRRWGRKIVLFLALAVMPLQAAAGTLSFLLCHGEAQAHAAHAHPDHEGGSNHAEQNSDHGPASGHDSGSTSTALYHLCCNMAAFAPSAAVMPAFQPDFLVRALAPDLLHDLYFPDQPQRPPLA